MIFPMKLSEFTKSLNVASNSKKNNTRNCIFSPKNLRKYEEKHVRNFGKFVDKHVRNLKKFEKKHVRNVKKYEEKHLRNFRRNM